MNIVISKKLKWTIGIVLCLSLVVGLFLFFTMIGRPLPDLDSIESIKAEMSLSVGWKVFDIAPKYWPELWDAMQPAIIDLNLTKRLSYGFIKVKLKNNRIITIGLFVDAGVFSIGSWYYRGGDSTKMMTIIEQAYQDTIQTKP